MCQDWGFLYTPHLPRLSANLHLPVTATFMWFMWSTIALRLLCVWDKQQRGEQVLCAVQWEDPVKWSIHDHSASSQGWSVQKHCIVGFLPVVLAKEWRETSVMQLSDANTLVCLFTLVWRQVFHLDWYYMNAYGCYCDGSQISHYITLSFCLHILFHFRYKWVLHLKIKIHLHNYHDDCVQPFLSVIEGAALQYPGGWHLLQLKYIFSTRDTLTLWLSHTSVRA